MRKLSKEQVKAFWDKIFPERELWQKYHRGKRCPECGRFGIWEIKVVNLRKGTTEIFWECRKRKCQSLL